MKIEKVGIAGSLESSDVQVTVEPSTNGIVIDIESSVEAQYGESIRASVEQVLERMAITAVNITLVDKGALDCTIRARVETALLRAVGIDKGIAWGDLIV